MLARLEQHQIAAYLAAIAVGIGVGLAWPAGVDGLGRAITPLLGLLLYATFLQVPAAKLVDAARSGRFLAAVLLLNFAVVPVVVAALFALLPADQAVRFGVLLVLLCPCVDYVIVFSGLAGGNAERLLAATPILLLVQMALLPLYLWLFLGDGLSGLVRAAPFLEAFGQLIVVPLVLAWLTQWLASRSAVGEHAMRAGETVMVPLMMAVLFVVVASQVPGLDGRWADVGRVIPMYVAFAAVMVAIGILVSRLLTLPLDDQRAAVFSGVTRNSLVVLPFALALPVGMESAAAVVVAQTLTELVLMVILIRLMPRLIPSR